MEKCQKIYFVNQSISQFRDDASTIQHLKTLSDELSKLSIVHLPDLPSIKYSPKKITDSDIDQLIETYSLWYVHVIEIITINLYYKYIHRRRWLEMEEQISKTCISFVDTIFIELNGEMSKNIFR
jgi:hypothetical protein